MQTGSILIYCAWNELYEFTCIAYTFRVYLGHLLPTKSQCLEISDQHVTVWIQRSAVTLFAIFHGKLSMRNDVKRLTKCVYVTIDREFTPSKSVRPTSDNRNEHGCKSITNHGCLRTNSYSIRQKVHYSLNKTPQLEWEVHDHNKSSKCRVARKRHCIQEQHLTFITVILI